MYNINATPDAILLVTPQMVYESSVKDQLLPTVQNPDGNHYISYSHGSDCVAIIVSVPGAPITLSGS